LSRISLHHEADLVPNFRFMRGGVLVYRGAAA